MICEHFAHSQARHIFASVGLTCWNQKRFQCRFRKTWESGSAYRIQIHTRLDEVRLVARTIRVQSVDWRRRDFKHIFLLLRYPFFAQFRRLSVDFFRCARFCNFFLWWLLAFGKIYSRFNHFYLEKHTLLGGMLLSVKLQLVFVPIFLFVFYICQTTTSHWAANLNATTDRILHWLHWFTPGDDGWMKSQGAEQLLERKQLFPLSCSRKKVHRTIVISLQVK